MRNPMLAERADRILARLFPTRFAAGAREGRHGRVGAPHLWRMQRAFQIDFLQRMGRVSAGALGLLTKFSYFLPNAPALRSAAIFAAS